MFQVIKDLRIGQVIEVSGTRITIEIDAELSSLSRTYKGKVYSIGQIGSTLKIHFGRVILFANVAMLRMKSDLNFDGSNISLNNDSRIIEADLIGQGSFNGGYLDFTRGVEIYPLPQQSAFLMTETELNLLYTGAEKTIENEKSPLVPIGTYSGTNQVCRADINKLFGNHSAILGSTGSGKSGTVASILHSLLKHGKGVLNPRIIMIDPHNEYGKAFANDSLTYRAYSGSNDQADSYLEIKLPYWLMTSDEFRSLVIGKTEHEATTLNNIVYDAITYARMVCAGVVNRLDDDPVGGVIPTLCDGKTEEDRINFNRDKPIPFKLADFKLHIDKVQGRKTDNRTNLAQSNGRDKIESILKKLRLLVANPQLDFMLDEWDEDSINLPKVILQLVGKNDEEEKNIKIIDISGLPNEVAGLLTALIARLIFQYKFWQSRIEREKDPVLLIFEEAHRYVPNNGDAQYKEAQSAIRRIAKEGRKYGLGLMLVSQRPSDVEKTVLSQCNSWIIMRLTNSVDQQYVSSFIPDNLSSLTKLLPSLIRREAIFVGEASAIPSRIKIATLEEHQIPASADIDFIKGWENPMLEVGEINNTIQRWVNY